MAPDESTNLIETKHYDPVHNHPPVDFFSLPFIDSDSVSGNKYSLNCHARIRRGFH
jgi:hypothetical protein